MAGVTSVVIDGTTYLVDDINAVDFSEDQGLSEQQQEQGRSNIGAASTVALADKADESDVDALESALDNLSDDVAEFTEQLVDKASAIVDTASGAIASFPDGAAVAAKDVTIGIEPVQAGSGDPSPDNVRPISGWTGANVTRTGKNLCTIQDRSISSAGYVFQGDLINNVGGILAGTYTVSFVASGFANGSALEFIFRDENDQTINSEVKSLSSGRNSITITIERNAVKARSYTNSSSGVSLSDFQIEVGSTATPYEPYTGTTIPISWQSVAGTVYGGTLDVTTGLLTVDRAKFKPDSNTVVRANSSSWNPNYPSFYFSIPLYSVMDNTKIICISNAMMGVARNQIQRINQPFACSVAGGFNEIDFTSTLQTAEENKQWMIDNNVEFVYLLNNPQTYQLTPTEVEMLLGDNNVWADTGDSTVAYRADTKLYIQKINAPTDDDMIADAQIASGKYFIVGGNLYKSTTTIPAGDTITPGTNCILTNLADALNALNT